MKGFFKMINIIMVYYIIMIMNIKNMKENFKIIYIMDMALYFMNILAKYFSKELLKMENK